MTVIIEQRDRDVEYIEDAVHVHIQVDNWVTISFDGERENRTLRIDHTNSISIVP